ncbi:hypothetical protein C0J52_10750 [Blattella germanica]|nr:hypothetical protein C0J52_10750 [Blattella germanica]
MVLSRKRCGAFSRNKKSARKATVERPDSHLSHFQNEIIAFIGQLDSTTCLMMLRDPYVESDSIPWAACLKESLTLPLPFDDMKLKIKLVVELALSSSDRSTRFTACELLHAIIMFMLGTVVELALSSSDRSTRFTACELLHAIIMFMLGTAHKYQTSDPDRYAELFRKLCMPLLRLGCDPDQAIQSLFSILVLQLVHWYSSKFMLRSKETSFFIESLLCNRRRKPPEFDGITLKDAVCWLLVKCGSIQPDCRHQMFEAMIFFIENMSGSDANAAVKLMGSSSETPDVVTWEMENYERTKCFVIVRVLDFMSVVLQSSEPACLPEALLSSRLWHMIAKCVLLPSSLGFDLRSTEVLNGLPDNLISLLKVLLRTLSKSYLAELISEISKIIVDLRAEIFGKQQEILKYDKVSIEQKQFLLGLMILHKSGMLMHIPDCKFDGTLVIKTFFSALVEDHNGTKQAVVLQPTSLEFAELILRFSFLLIDNIDIIIECIKEQTVVKNPVTNVTLHHGEHFFLTFRSVILDQMVENFENSLHCLVGDLSLDNFQWIIRILTELLQHAMKKQRKDLRTNTGDCFKKVVIQYWSSLSNITEKNTEDTYQFLGLLINFARAVPEPIGFLMAHEEVSRWVTSQITSEKLQPHHKIRALDLLVCLTGPQDVDNVELKKTMKLFKDQHIPQISSELQVGSLEYSSFVSMFRKILLALEDSGSPTLLYSLVYITASETKHICENEIQQSLQTFIKKLDFRSQVQAIKVVYEFVFQENYDAQIRLNCTQRFIQTLLQGCRPAAAIAFYKDCITKLLQLVGDGLEKRDRLRAERQLVGKISAWNLLELMFLLLECSELESKECAITVAAFPGAVNTGKELIKDVSDKAYNYRKENIPIDMAGNDRIVELFRKSQCAAFSTLVAVISCTKTTAADAKFYAGLLFSENSKTKEVPWEKIVDTKKVYRLTLDWEEIPKRRKKMVNIRSEARTQRKLIAGFASQSIRYIPNSSQYLFDSTLNEDVTLFDMSTSIVSSQASTALQEQFSAPSLEIELECDDVNEHECMATLCGVIQHMVDRKISPLPAVGTVEDLPSWMEHLRKCLTDSRRPQNVRLFLMKLVLNMESVFQPFLTLPGCDQPT